MKGSFLIFFLMVLGIYAIGNIYLYIRGWQALEIMGGRQRIWFTVVFWLLASSFLVTQMLRMGGASGVLFDAILVIGSWWVAIMLYGFLTLLVIDAARVVAWAGNIRPEWIYQYYVTAKAMMFGAVCLILLVIMGIGYRNAQHPQVSHLEISVDKHAGQLSSLRVAMVSDIHLGHVTGRKSLARIVDALNEQQADIVLLAGDTFDGGPAPVIRKDICVEFDRLRSRYGVYAVSGNHEYIGERETKNAVNTAFDYLATHGVTPLQDSVVLINNSFYVAGRKDLSAAKRKTIPDLLAKVDTQLPVIMLDHQPYHLEDVQQAGVDLQLSGHTHHGQMWPLNCITRKIYEQDWGFLQKGSSYFYVSCGVGTWGPPVRTAGRSEIVVIDLKFNHKNEI